MKLPKRLILFSAVSNTCIVGRNFNRSTLSYVTIVCIMFWIVEHLMNNKLDMGSILYEGDSHKSGVIGKKFYVQKKNRSQKSYSIFGPAKYFFNILVAVYIETGKFDLH